LNLGVGSDCFGRLGYLFAIDMHQPGFDRGLCLGAAVEQAAVDQQAIDAYFFGCHDAGSLSQLHRLGGGVLAKRFEHLGDDTFGVEPGGAIHRGRRIVIDENVR
jgi:hypothetical protein